MPTAMILVFSLVFYLSGVRSWADTAKTTVRYVQPVQDIRIPVTNALPFKPLVPLATYPLVDDFDDGYVILCDVGGKTQVLGFVPWCDRMGNPVANIQGNWLQMRVMVDVTPRPGFIPLRKSQRYPILTEQTGGYSILFSAGGQSWTVAVSRADVHLAVVPRVPLSGNGALTVTSTRTGEISRATTAAVPVSTLRLSNGTTVTGKIEHIGWSKYRVIGQNIIKTYGSWELAREESQKYESRDEWLKWLKKNAVTLEAVGALWGPKYSIEDDSDLSRLGIEPVVCYEKNGFKIRAGYRLIEGTHYLSSLCAWKNLEVDWQHFTVEAGQRVVDFTDSDVQFFLNMFSAGHQWKARDIVNNGYGGVDKLWDRDDEEWTISYNNGVMATVPRIHPSLLVKSNLTEADPEPFGSSVQSSQACPVATSETEDRKIVSEQSIFSPIAASTNRPKVGPFTMGMSLEKAEAVAKSLEMEPYRFMTNSFGRANQLVNERGWNWRKDLGGPFLDHEDSLVPDEIEYRKFNLHEMADYGRRVLPMPFDCVRLYFVSNMLCRVRFDGYVECDDTVHGRSIPEPDVRVVRYGDTMSTTSIARLIQPMFEYVAQKYQPYTNRYYVNFLAFGSARAASVGLPKDFPESLKQYYLLVPRKVDDWGYANPQEDTFFGPEIDWQDKEPYIFQSADGLVVMVNKPDWLRGTTTTCLYSIDYHDDLLNKSYGPACSKAIRARWASIPATIKKLKEEEDARKKKEAVQGYGGL